MLTAVGASVWAKAEYLRCHLKAVAHTETALRFLVFAATGVCPDSTQANGAGVGCAKGFEQEGGNDPHHDDGETSPHFFHIQGEDARANPDHAEDGDQDIGNEVNGAKPH